MTLGRLTYANAGVDASGAERALDGLLESVRSTFSLRPGIGKPLLSMGFFANVLDLGQGIGLAISTDGVGTKALIAQQVGKYDTIGIDCVAMNVNDVLCVGAEPLAMTDYLAVEAPHADLFSELGKGLLRGAQMAEIVIPGGEVAQIREMIHGDRDGYGFDLVGTCVGVVPTDRLLIGADVQPGDVIVGVASAGIHSNGLTLARRALLGAGGLALDDHVAELGRTLGEELLEPTAIYVRYGKALLQSVLNVKAFTHVTSDGFLNLTRIANPAVGFVLDALPQPPPIFGLIQAAGDVADAEMFFVYNMGIGFCVVIPEADAEAACALAPEYGHRAQIIGRVVADPERAVQIPQRRLVGREGRFHQL